MKNISNKIDSNVHNRIRCAVSTDKIRFSDGHNGVFNTFSQLYNIGRMVLYNVRVIGYLASLGK